jgi:two-component system, OmpR family, KDP operon response regulator KdpE
LLRVLATNRDRVLTHRQLLELVWGGYAAENAQQLRVYISYLRRKLEDDPARPHWIVTEPGVGYRLRTGNGS